MDAIHTFAREEELDNFLKCIESGVSVHLQDSEGRTLMHWAVDRGHLKIAEALLSRNADVNAKTDDELMDELDVQPLNDVDDEEFESDFDNLYSTDEEILAMFLMK
ncbi:hypothetical protein ERO13_D03G054050v2 [Gossypium hirsutum]|nr:hypothetical protein ERO13_D03G054050v2 [Gossypium hirsutum]